MFIKRQKKQSSDTQRMLSLTGKWEKKTGLESNLRTMGSDLPKIAALCADLTDEEVLVVITAIGEVIDDDEEEVKPTLIQKVLAPVANAFLDSAPKYRLGALRQAEYYVILAPAWNALNGMDDSAGYAMRQATYYFRDENDGTSTEPFYAGEQAEAKRNWLTASMISYSVGGRINKEDLDWFGANWKSYAPVWPLVKDDSTIYRSRVEAMMANLNNGGPAAISSGAL